MDVRYEDPRALAEAALERDDLGRRIQGLAGWGERDRERFLAGPVAALAAWHLTLPAAPDHHAEAGGALRQAVETGWAALRLAEAAVFAAAETSERRRRLEPQYRLAAWLAALASNLHGPSSRIEVAAGEERWDCALGPLAPWLAARGTCEASWRASPLEADRSLAAFCARWVWPDPLPLDPQVARACVAAIAPGISQEGALARVVREAIARVEEAGRRRLAASWTPKPAPEASAVLEVEAEIAREAREAPGSAPSPQAQAAQPAAGGPDANVPAGSAPQAGRGSPRAEERGGKDAPLEPACADLLRMLAKRAADPAGARKLSWERDGLAVPLSMLTEIGLSSEGALALLRRSGVLVRKDGRRFVIAPAAGERVLAREAGKAAAHA